MRDKFRNLKRLSIACVLAALFVLLSACGGGGGGSDPEPGPGPGPQGAVWDQSNWDEDNWQ